MASKGIRGDMDGRHRPPAGVRCRPGLRRPPVCAHRLPPYERTSPGKTEPKDLVRHGRDWRPPSGSPGVTLNEHSLRAAPRALPGGAALRVPEQAGLEQKAVAKETKPMTEDSRRVYVKTSDLTGQRFVRWTVVGRVALGRLRAPQSSTVAASVGLKGMSRPPRSCRHSRPTAAAESGSYWRPQPHAWSVGDTGISLLGAYSRSLHQSQALAVACVRRSGN